jgi:RNA polymerase sigma-70 factor (ECF subfamily)
MPVKNNNLDFLQNNSKSKDAIYRYFAPKMYGICLRFAGNEMEAQDILHDGFIKVFSKLDDFRNDGSFEGWIRRTMINTAINFYRKKTRETIFSNIDDKEVAEKESWGIMNRLSKEELLNLIQELPIGYRTVFNLNVLEGYTHKEIGLMMNISDNTSKSQLTRARSILQRKVLAMVKEKVKVPFADFRVIKNDDEVTDFIELLEAV